MPCLHVRRLGDDCFEGRITDIGRVVPEQAGDGGGSTRIYQCGAHSLGDVVARCDCLMRPVSSAVLHDVDKVVIRQNR